MADALETNLEEVETKKGALRVLRKVVALHKHDLRIERYDFFKEHMDYARLAANTLRRKANWPTLSTEDRRNVYYARRHFSG